MSDNRDIFKPDKNVSQSSYFKDNFSELKRAFNRDTGEKDEEVEKPEKDTDSEVNSSSTHRKRVREGIFDLEPKRVIQTKDEVIRT